MDKSEIIQKIIIKREFSDLPLKDVEMAFSHFEKRQTSDEDKVKLTRDLLRKVFSVFGSEKLLNKKNLEAEYVLKKHISTRERLGSYKEIYSRVLKEINPNEFSIIDLGCGVNGFSYGFFPKKMKINYVGVEAMGQLVDLTNNYFYNKKISGLAIHLSLFELEKIKQVIKDVKSPKVIFLFKTLDSLEMLERDYSKRLLKEIVPLADRVVVSFATRSLVARKKFHVERNWILNFIKENFNLLDDFELGSERYVSFCKK